MMTTNKKEYKMDKTEQSNIIKAICLTIIPISFAVSLLALYQMLSIFPLAIITTVFVIGGIIYTVCCFKHREHIGIIPMCASCTFTLICICTVIYTITIFSTAQTHGMYTSDMTISETKSSIEKSPVEDTLPEDINGSIVIYYRFGCTDCEAIYTDLSKTISDKDNIYWVSTESDQGKKLMDAYPIDSVPSGIYIYNNKQNSNTYVQKPLYKTSENASVTFFETTEDAENLKNAIYSNDVILDKTALERLLYLQEKQK